MVAGVGQGRGEGGNYELRMLNEPVPLYPVNESLNWMAEQVLLGLSYYAVFSRCDLAKELSLPADFFVALKHRFSNQCQVRLPI